MTAHLMKPRRSLVARAARKAGFTLIELLAVILIIGVLATFLLPKIPEAIDQARVTACQANLREIYKGFLSYQVSHKRLPKREYSGVQFFACLVAKGEWENTESSAMKLTCPGVDIGFLECGDLPPTEWYIDLDLVTGGYSTYAGRDTESYPLRKLEKGTEALVGDDNDPDMNHRQATNVLFGDGNVKSYILSDLVDDGLIDREAGYLPVGPESPVEPLQKLTLE